MHTARDEGGAALASQRGDGVVVQALSRREPAG